MQDCEHSTCSNYRRCKNNLFKEVKLARVTEVFQHATMGRGVRALGRVSRGTRFLVSRCEVMPRPPATYENLNYVMEVGREEFVDLTGEDVGMVNHACEPNSLVVIRREGGWATIALEAKRDLKNGEQVTFDYHANTQDRLLLFQCSCGGGSCRGR